MLDLIPDQNGKMTLAERLERFVGLMADAHAATLGAKEACPDLGMAEIVHVMANRQVALIQWARGELAKLTPGGEPGQGAAAAGSVPPEPVPPADTGESDANADA
jgi:hypothetical protein